MKSLLWLAGCLAPIALLLASSAEVAMTKWLKPITLNASTTAAGDSNPAELMNWVETHFDDSAGVDGLNDAWSVAISPNGEHVYIAGEVDDALALFNRHPATGELTFVEAYLNPSGDGYGLDGVKDVVVSPDGLNVYAVSFYSEAVAAFSRNPADGGLTFIEKHQPADDVTSGIPSFPILPVGLSFSSRRLRQAYQLTISPDGQNVYATGYYYDTVVVHRREADGSLTVIQLIDDANGQNYGIDAPRGVEVSNDGRHVFIAGAVSDALVVFERAADGSLNTDPAHFQVYQDGVAGVDGLEGSNIVKVSPDDANVYVTSVVEDAVAAFSRDADPLSPTFGRLTFLDAYFKNIDGVDGIDTPRDLTVSPDGRYVFTIGRDNDAVASFRRESDGRLTFIEAIINGEGIEVGGADISGAEAIVATLDVDQFTTYVYQLTQEPLGNRAVGTPANQIAVDWIADQFAAMGYTVERHAFSWNSLTLENVMATKIGASRPDQMYIVSAHMDHINNDGLLNRGADDDASGTALVLEAARVFSLPGVETDCSIRFICWNAEEKGLVGAKAYINDRAALQGIEDPPGSGLYPEPTWLGMIQHDMILYDHGYGILNTGPGPAYSGADMDIEYQWNSVFRTESLALAHALNTSSGFFSAIYPSEIGSNMNSTDSQAFQNYCPAIGLLENQVSPEIRYRNLTQSNPIYHQPGDVFEYYTEADYQFAFNFVQMTVGAVAALAKGEMAISYGDHLEGLAWPRGVTVSPDSAHVYVVSRRDNAVVVFAMGWAAATLAGADVEVSPLDRTTGLTQATMTFSNVTTGGVTSIETGMDGPAPPEGFWSGPLSYFNVETTAGYAGSIQLCLNYDPVFVGENTIHVFHYISDVWVEIIPISVNAENHTVCFEVSSLGALAVFTSYSGPLTQTHTHWQLYK